MLFTVGNLVTLGIVATMFIAYHLLTADNRSLDKIRRMADNIKQELSDYVAALVNELKGYGIDLKVQQQAAKVILEKIQTTQGEIEARSESIATIADRFREYDEILEKLMEMTKRVDQNIKNLATQNDFVENLARRIENLSRQTARLESDLPAIETRFSEDAQHILDGFRDDILAQLGERLDQVLERLEAARTEAGSAVVRAETAQQEIESKASQALELAQQRALSIEDTAFATLRDSMAQRTDAIEKEYKERLASLDSTMETRLASLREAIAAFVHDWNTQSEELSAALSEISASAKHAITEYRAALESQTGAQRALLEDARRQAEEIRLQLAQLRDQAVALAGEIRQHHEHATRELEERFAKFGEAFETHRASFEEEFTQELSALEGGLADARQQLQDLRHALEQSATAMMEQLSQSVGSDIEATREQLYQRIDRWLTEMDAKMRSIMQDAVEQRKAEEARLAQEVASELKRLKDTLYTQIQRMDRDIEALKNS